MKHKRRAEIYHLNSILDMENNNTIPAMVNELSAVNEEERYDAIPFFSLSEALSAPNINPRRITKRH
ncbi:MAG: hypothetical protein MRQ07_03035 [Candidatus Midichloria sp.]|nr:hypothetical protein [Candidatus Midichloria sp.]